MVATLPRGENDNQARRSSIAHMSKKCVYTTGKRCAVGHADDSEGVTMRSGRRVNDDTLGQSQSYDGLFRCFSWRTIGAAC